MPTMYIKGYEVEVSGEPLIGGDTWGAYVSIYSSSKNPIDSKKSILKLVWLNFVYFSAKRQLCRTLERQELPLLSAFRQTEVFLVSLLNELGMPDGYGGQWWRQQVSAAFSSDSPSSRL